MRDKEDRDTRFFIDVDITTGTIFKWGYDHKAKLIQNLNNPSHHRLFISKGQYNKFEQKIQNVKPD